MKRLTISGVILLVLIIAPLNANTPDSEDISLEGVYLGELYVTSYRSVPNQTDDSPFFTAIGERVHPFGMALSRDLLARWGGPVKYGDVVMIEGVGLKRVNDVMNARHKQRGDVWVSSLNDERAFHKKFKNRKLKVWLIKGESK